MKQKRGEVAKHTTLLIITAFIIFSTLSFAEDARFEIMAHRQDDAAALIRKDVSTGNEIMLIDTIQQPYSGKIRHMSQIVVSRDNKWIYFLTDGWETSAALHRVRMDGSGYEFLTDANDVRIITKGEYKDMLVIDKHIYPLAGSAIDLFMVYDPETKKEVRIFSQETYDQLEEWQINKYFNVLQSE